MVWLRACTNCIEWPNMHDQMRAVQTEAVVALSGLPCHGGQGGVSSCRGELLRTPSGLRLPRVRQAHEHN